MFTIFVYADVVDLRSKKIEKAACIQQFKAEGKHLVDAIAEGEEHAYTLSDIYEHVEFAVWNEKSRSIDFRGRPNRVTVETSSGF